MNRTLLKRFSAVPFSRCNSSCLNGSRYLSSTPTLPQPQIPVLSSNRLAEAVVAAQVQAIPFRSSFPIKIYTVVSLALTASTTAYLCNITAVPPVHLESSFFGSSSAPSKKHQISIEDIELLSERVTANMDLPFLPEPVERVIIRNVLHLCLDRIDHGLSPELKDELTILRSTGGGVTDDFVLQLAEDCAKSTPIPLLDHQQRKDLFVTTFTVLLQDDTVAGIASKAIATTTVSTAKTLLDEQAREQVVQDLCKNYPIPLMPQIQQAAILRQGLNLATMALQRILPPELEEILCKDATRTEIEQLRDQLVVLINSNVDIPGIDEQTEHQLIQKLCDIIINSLLRQSGLEDSLHTPLERLDKLRTQQAMLQSELGAIDRLAARRKVALKKKLDDIEKQKQEAKKVIKAMQK